MAKAKETRINQLGALTDFIFDDDSRQELASILGKDSTPLTNQIEEFVGDNCFWIEARSHGILPSESVKSLGKIAKLAGTLETELSALPEGLSWMLAQNAYSEDTTIRIKEELHNLARAARQGHDFFQRLVRDGREMEQDVYFSLLDKLAELFRDNNISDNPSYDQPLHKVLKMILNSLKPDKTDHHWEQARNIIRRWQKASGN